MQSHVIIPEADIRDAVYNALIEAEHGAYLATQQGVHVLFDGTIDFDFVVLRTENGVELNSTTTKPQIIATAVENNPEIITVSLREEAQDKTTVTEEIPEDLTTSVETNPEVVSEHTTLTPASVVQESVSHAAYTNSGDRSATDSTTTTTKTGADNTTVNREYDEY